MTLQALAAVAALVHLAVIASACAAGLLLARRVRIAWWAGVAAMLLITRSVTASTAYTWSTPAAPEAFPWLDVALGAVALGALSWQALHVRRSARRTLALVAAATDTRAGLDASEAHADAA